MPTVERQAPTGLAHRDWHQILRRLPELAVDEIGGEAAHPREGFRLSWPDFACARLEGCKRLLHQLIRGDQAGAALGKRRRHVGLYCRGHELNDLYAGFLQLEPQRLGVGVNSRLGGAVDWRGRQRDEGEPGGYVDHRTLIGSEDVDKQGSHADYAAYVDVHLRR